MKLKSRKIENVQDGSRSSLVSNQQHQHQHVTAKLRSSDDAREDAVQLEQRERDTSVSPKKAAKEKRDKNLALVHNILQEKKKGWVCVRQQKHEKNGGL